MIPSLSRPEWQQLIKGKIDIKIESFSLQMKLNALKKNQKTGIISLDEAVKDLHSLCVKFERIYTKDLEKIFNTSKSEF